MANESLAMKIECVKKKLAEAIPSREINGELVFEYPDNAWGRLTDLFGGLLMEYASSLQLAEEGIFGEDGDVYNPELPDEELVALLMEDGGY